jgi:dynein heavy chain
MWDLIALIDTQFGAWKKQLWEAIDTENLVQLIKKMMDEQTKPTLPANKDIKNYVAFTSLNERVKNMNQLIPLIARLHDKYMMERHWKKLQIICQKTVPYSSPQFCLEDLINMELHKFVDDVNELVDGAAKENKIEGKL